MRVAYGKLKTNYNRMKYITKCWWLLIFTGLFLSCEQKDIDIYQEKPGISFKTLQSSFSFIGKQDVLSDTLDILVVISGEAKDYDRVVKAETVADTNTTASPEQYRLLDGVVKTGEYQGYVPVVMNYSEELDSVVKRLQVRLIETADFREVRLGVTTFQIQFSAKVMKPDNWDLWLYRYFANYSDSWYKFILKVVGRTSIPCWPVNCPEPENYPMTAMEAVALKNKVKMALTEYNATQDDVLRHEDGEWKGQPVTMP